MSVEINFTSYGLSFLEKNTVFFISSIWIIFKPCNVLSILVKDLKQ